MSNPVKRENRIVWEKLELVAGHLGPWSVAKQPRVSEFVQGNGKWSGDWGDNFSHHCSSKHPACISQIS